MRMWLHCCRVVIVVILVEWCIDCIYVNLWFNVYVCMCVTLLSNAVSTISTNNTESVMLNVFWNDRTDITKENSRFHCLNGQIQCFICCINQPAQQITKTYISLSLSLVSREDNQINSNSNSYQITSNDTNFLTLGSTLPMNHVSLTSPWTPW
jgi:hypothetical protein